MIETKKMVKSLDVSATQTSAETKKRIVTFLLLTFALSSVFYALIILSGTTQAAGGLYVLGMMWCPGIAAIATRLLFQGNLRGFGWHWGKTRYQLLSYALPFVLGLAAYVPVWLTGLGGFYNQDFVESIASRLGWTTLSPGIVIIFHLARAGTIGMLFSCVSALGEEIGWRGFLVPELAKITSFSKVSLISGLIWAAWHYPALLFADYNSGTPAWYGLVCFTVLIVGFSFVLAWLRIKSGSLWTAMFLHASYNLFVQQVFTPLTTDTGITPYVITEFGAAMAVVYVIAALVFWNRRSELPDLQCRKT
jgi:membrane protease YdiL (CAAX protease family)